jgi:hypothetical protein
MRPGVRNLHQLPRVRFGFVLASEVDIETSGTKFSFDESTPIHISLLLSLSLYSVSFCLSFLLFSLVCV